MADKKQGGLGDELYGTRLGELRDTAGPAKGEFVPPPDVSGIKEIEEALPEQEEFWRPPARFGSIPVEKEPLGCISYGETFEQAMEMIKYAMEGWLAVARAEGVPIPEEFEKMKAKADILMFLQWQNSCARARGFRSMVWCCEHRQGGSNAS